MGMGLGSGRTPLPSQRTHGRGGPGIDRHRFDISLSVTVGASHGLSFRIGRSGRPTSPAIKRSGRNALRPSMPIALANPRQPRSFHPASATRQGWPLAGCSPASGWSLGPALANRLGYERLRPLNVCLSSPSDVMSRYSTSAKYAGSTQVALGFLIGLVSLDFGLTTVSSCFRIWLETVRDQPVPLRNERQTSLVR
jgi:hypothetical protein